MVIDDDKTTTILCEHTLRKFSPITPLIVYMEPEIALEAIEKEYGIERSNIPTVMFLDINMPGMSGWEFLEKYEKFDAKIHAQFTIYVLSSSIDERDHERSQSNPFVSGHLSKPLRLESVIQIFDIVNNNSIKSFNKLRLR